MKKIKVTRVLVYEGDEKWVRAVLNQSYIRPKQTFAFVVGSVYELERKEEVVEDGGENS